ncbi:MAG TPA: response regulator [Verrucomicrobiae bacterium]|jgi:CheY-like chemotaxis protein
MSRTPVIQWPEFQHETLLLVEDNDDDVFIMRAAWRKSGISNRLETVRDGEEAVQYLSGSGAWGERAKFPLPTVILLDLNLPKKSGLEVLQWVREQKGLKHISVQILTASTRAEDVQRAFELGVNDYLVKPSKIESLVEMLKAWQAFAQFKAFPGAPGGKV